MKNTKPESEYSHTEIQDAMKEFLSKGKKVKMLPPQKATSHQTIGGYNWGPYESIDDIGSTLY